MLAEDLDVFLSDFGEACTVGGSSITGIFAESSTEDLEVLGYAASLTCKTSALPAGVTTGTAVSVDGRSWTVKAAIDEKIGFTVLTLALADV